MRPIKFVKFSVLILCSSFISVLICEANSDLRQESADVDSKDPAEAVVPIDCDSLLPGQYLCNDLASIDPATQQPAGQSDNLLKYLISSDAP